MPQMGNQLPPLSEFDTKIWSAWWGEIKVWFGWTDWLHAVWKTGLHIGGIWFAYYLTGNVEDLIGSLAVDLGQLLIASAFAYIVLFVTYGRAAKKLFVAQQEIIETQKLELDKLESTKSNNIFKLFVSSGTDIITPGINGEFNVTLTLDVINKESKKIVDLEAYVTSIIQYTEPNKSKALPPNSFTTFRSSRLEWKDGNYVIDLAPGFPESFIKIVTLYVFRPIVAFENENPPRAVMLFQEDAFYTIEVKFRGRLDGETDYKFFYYKTSFISAPRRSQIGFLESERRNPNLPNWLLERIEEELNKAEDN